MTPPDTSLEAWRLGLPIVLGAALDGAGSLRVSDAEGRAQRTAGASAEPGSARPGLHLTGHLIPSGPDSVRVMALLTDRGARQRLGEVEVREERGRLDRMLDSLTMAILRELGRSRSVAVTPRAGFAARSLPAVKAYLRGEQFARVSHWDSAFAWYERAIAADSGFALAWFRAGTAAQYLRTQVEWDSYNKRAGELVAFLPQRESLLVTMKAQVGRVSAGYPGWETPLAGAAATAVRTARLARELYPSDADVQYEAGNVLVTLTGMQALDRREGIRAYARSVHLDSGYAPPYTRLVMSYLSAGMEAEARAVLERTVTRFRAQEHLQTAPMVAALMAPGLDSSGRAAIMDSMSTDGLFMVWGILARWPDASETQVALAAEMAARADARNPFIARPATRRGIHAYSLAFRGHLAAAAAWMDGARSRSRPLAVVLGRYGAVHDSAVEAVWQAAVDSGRMGMQGAMLAWLLDRGRRDVLAEFVVRARRQAPRGDTVPLGPHYAGIATAYVAMLEGDSAAAREGLRRADTLCAAGCADARLELLRLLRAGGYLEEALVFMQREVRPWIFDWTDPIDVEWQLERGRVHAALGQRREAEAAYRYVASAWRLPDPVLMSKVSEARAYLAAGRPGGR